MLVAIDSWGPGKRIWAVERGQIGRSWHDRRVWRGLVFDVEVFSAWINAFDMNPLCNRLVGLVRLDGSPALSRSGTRVIHSCGAFILIWSRGRQCRIVSRCRNDTISRAW